MIVLDTHIWVRWLDPTADPLPQSLIDKIETAETLAISTITCWEVAWLNRRGRIILQLPLADWIDQPKNLGWREKIPFMLRQAQHERDFFGSPNG